MVHGAGRASRGGAERRVAEREAGAGVLTTELKVNLLAPAQGEQLVASGCVVIWDAASSAEVAAMKHGGGWVSGVALSRPPCSNIA